MSWTTGSKDLFLPEWSAVPETVPSWAGESTIRALATVKNLTTRVLELDRHEVLVDAEGISEQDARLTTIRVRISAFLPARVGRISLRLIDADSGAVVAFPNLIRVGFSDVWSSGPDTQGVHMAVKDSDGEVTQLRVGDILT